MEALVESLNDRLQHERDRGTTDATAGPIESDTDVMARQWRKQRPRLQLDAFDLGLRIRHLAMLIDNELSRAGEHFGVKSNELLLLMALRRAGPPYELRPTDILKMLSVTSGTVTYRIDKLIEQDLAARAPDPSDLRGYLIRLTPHGLDVIDKSVERLASRLTTAVTPLLGVTGAYEVLVPTLRLFETCLSDGAASIAPSATPKPRKRAATR